MITISNSNNYLYADEFYIYKNYLHFQFIENDDKKIILISIKHDTIIKLFEDLKLLEVDEQTFNFLLKELDKEINND